MQRGSSFQVFDCGREYKKWEDGGMIKTSYILLNCFFFFLLLKC